MLSGFSGEIDMRPIPPPLQAQFEDHLRKKGVPKQEHGLFKKWLRYYLDFCEKYQFRATGKEGLPEFLGKLGEKRQTKVQQEQPARAIKVFYEIIDENSPSRKPTMDSGSAPARQAYDKDVKQRYMQEGSSKTWGVPGASPQNPQSPKRVFRQEASRGDRIRRRAGSVLVTMETQTARHAVGAAEKKRAERRDGRSAVASRQTMSGREASWEAEYALWPMRSKFATIVQRLSGPIRAGCKNSKPFRRAKSRCRFQSIEFPGQKVPERCERFHLAMVLSGQTTDVRGGYRGTQALSPA
jgi:hypothetical protein